MSVVDSGHECVGGVFWGYEIHGNDERGWRWSACELFDSWSGVTATRAEAKQEIEDRIGTHKIV